MVDDRDRPAPSSRTRPTRWPQPAVTDLADERHIALLIAQGSRFVEKHGRPKVGVVGQTLTNIDLDYPERVRLRCRPLPGNPSSRQVSPHCFSVSSQMAGNSPHRPSPSPQRVYFHEFLLCQHQERDSSPRCRISQSAAWRGPHSTSGICHHRVGNLIDRDWGVSTIVNKAGIEPSVGSVGDSYDNALAESVIGLYKTELIHKRAPWKDLDQVEYATLEYVDWFNHRRLLEPIGHIPPAEKEANYHRQQKRVQLAGLK